ncbi:hypothetical protein N1F78_12005 [Seonamhaeicola sp. MEBiC1930]|uniref:hypothetical protein n=1 Tax=Seonamhaeicola sp. MEBiC01930 TaxID=2976768 RepID=UPI0032532AE0
MTRNKRRHNTGFGYIGFGNNQSIFNQSSKKAFSTLKEKLNKETHSNFKLDFTHKALSKTEKEIIKNKIRKDEGSRFKKTVIISSIITILVLLFISFIINKIMANP